MSFLNDEVGFASGYDGGIYTTSNSGNNWEILASSNKLWKQRIHLNDIYFINSQKGVVVGNNGIVIITYDGGNHWQKTKIDGDLHFYSVHYHYDGIIWVTSSGGKILKINI
jgi:photosystem II stability/assembly factor-like uncharacterized protein